MPITYTNEQLVQELIDRGVDETIAQQIVDEGLVQNIGDLEVWLPEFIG